MSIVQPTLSRATALLALALTACSGGGSEEGAATTVPGAKGAPASVTTSEPTARGTGEPGLPDPGKDPDVRPPLPDVRHERLCAESADPDGAADTTFIDCRVEALTFADAPPPPKDDLTVLTYNLERGFEIDAQLAWLAGPGSPGPDVLLLQEADRGCERTGFRNIVAEMAEAIDGYSVFATEFVELPGDRGESGPYDPPLCEHGNAIVSRYPLEDARAIRHGENVSWYSPPGAPDPDEPRLGGRVAVAADVVVGGRSLRVYSLHLESRVEAASVRDAQAAEIAADAADLEGTVVVGGDLNAYGYAGDLESGASGDRTTGAFLAAGFVDAHGSVASSRAHDVVRPGPVRPRRDLRSGGRRGRSGTLWARGLWRPLRPPARMGNGLALRPSGALDAQSTTESRAGRSARRSTCGAGLGSAYLAGTGLEAAAGAGCAGRRLAGLAIRRRRDHDLRLRRRRGSETAADPLDQDQAEEPDAAECELRVEAPAPGGAVHELGHRRVAEQCDELVEVGAGERHHVVPGDRLLGPALHVQVLAALDGLARREAGG